MILFGFKGVGKTFLGQKVSQKLHVPFLDTDAMLYEKYKKPTKELHQELGEETFRKLECEIVQSLPQKTNAIIALGGGAICHPLNQKHLQSIGKLIYLKMDFANIQKRIKLPAFMDETFYETRTKIYERIDATCIDLDRVQEDLVPLLCNLYGL